MKLRGNFNPILECLDSMSAIGLSSITRFTAVSIYLLQTKSNSEGLCKLSNVTGISESVLQNHQIPALTNAGFLTIEDGIYCINKNRHMPEFSQEEKNKPLISIHVIKKYQDLWNELYGDTCIVSRKDREKARSLVKELGGPEVVKRLERYMKNKNDWLRKAAHPFAIFVAQINQYRDGNGQSKTDIIRHGTDFEKEVEAFESKSE